MYRGEAMYLLFCGYNYYPAGGWDDFHGSYHSEEEAREATDSLPRGTDWWQIVSLEDMSVVDIKY